MNAIWPKVAAVPRFAAPSSSASPVTTRKSADQRSGLVHASSLFTSAATGRAGSCSASSFSTARRPPRSRHALSPCSSVNSARAANRRARAREAAMSAPRGARRVRPPARRCRWAAGRYRRHRDDRRVARADCAQRGGQVTPRTARDVLEVGLCHHQDVGHLHDPGLQELQDVAGAGLDDHRHRVAEVRDVGLGLAHPDRLDDDHVERGGECLRGLARRRRQPAEHRPGGC